MLYFQTLLQNIQIQDNTRSVSSLYAKRGRNIFGFNLAKIAFLIRNLQFYTFSSITTSARYLTLSEQIKLWDTDTFCIKYAFQDVQNPEEIELIIIQMYIPVNQIDNDNFLHIVAQ
ncbi:Hypothetical_protein [Hexamita inflata]|uniref:Hypothetical_protein n=1 Tax=Hexamita inflata TaxID=28002 RepID=A0AA86QWB8_9EUKA|nr:Hypothetical protein HINF_LOCUS53471 [Hexamita inflata]CAI9965832.1 Hypothetical protein HINF_LOCUS53477 [Hexamita inflata]CAI9965835.1 Hypothetical protein HINF_LOCUS53480 [Hexamita inflata]